MEIKKNIKNDLFNRQEVSVIIDSEKNPNFSDARKMLSEHFKKSEDNIDVTNIQGKFGRNTFLIKAYIYDNKEYLVKMGNLRKTQKQKKAETQALVDDAKKKAEEKKSEESKEKVE
jgi:ribosomal protein S24E